MFPRQSSHCGAGLTGTHKRFLNNGSDVHYDPNWKIAVASANSGQACIMFI